MDEQSFEILKRTVSTQKKIKRTLQGDRYVLNGQEALVERDNREPVKWEAYEYLSAEADTVSIFVFRCMSPESERRLVLRGLDADATYRIEFHSGKPGLKASGAQLMGQGILCHLGHPRSADILILSRIA